VLKLFLNDQQKEILFDWQIALFITVKILRALFGGVGAGEVTEIKSFAF